MVPDRLIALHICSRWDINPYLKALKNGLTKLGVTSRPFESGTVLFARRALADHANVVHFHEMPFERRSNPLKWSKEALLLGQLMMLNAAGIRLVWTVHEIFDKYTGQPIFSPFTFRRLGQLLDAVIVHDPATATFIANLLGLSKRNATKIVEIPHAHVIDVYPNDVDRASSRKALGLNQDEFVFLQFGQLHMFKGVFEAVAAFKQLSGSDVRLLLVGEMMLSAEQQRDLDRQIAGHANITLIAGFVPDDKTQLFMNACDCVLLPYRFTSVSSGAVVLAMSFGKACLAPNRRPFSGLLDGAGGFLYDGDAETGLREALNNAIDRRTVLAEMGEHNLAVVRQITWEITCAATADVYRNARRPTRGAAPDRMAVSTSD